LKHDFTDVVSHLWKFLLCGSYLSLTVYSSTFWFQLKSAVLHWKVYTWAATLCKKTRRRRRKSFWYAVSIGNSQLTTTSSA